MAEETSVVVSVDDEGIGVIRFNRPAKYNSFREEDTARVNAALAQCAEDPAVRAVIVTGTGTYYSAGADFAASIQPQLLSTVRAHITEYNEGVFDAYLSFPKPLFAAVNGPAVGMGVTTASLADCIVASDTATFHTPFTALGLPPEGCSSYNFERLMGREHAEAMIVRGEKVDAHTALAWGFAAYVVPQEQLLERTKQLVREWIAAGKGRTLLAQHDLLSHLRVVNAQESKALGQAVTSRKFFEIQMRNAQTKGNTSVSWLFWLMAHMHPLMSKL